MISFWILFVIAFGATFYVMPHSIRKLRENGHVVVDMYKPDRPSIPTNAGIIVLFTSFVSISLLPLIIRIFNSLTPFEAQIQDLSEANLAFLLVISIYASYGLIDDLVDIGRKLKLFLPIVFSYPLISIINPETIWLPFTGYFDLTALAVSNFTWSDLFRVIIIPVYVMVVSNLVNMHSGYNGLQSGLSIILISSLVFESWEDGILDNIIPVGSFLGSLIALWWFNRYPARIFEGNVGSLLFGSIIGGIIVIQKYWWLGFFILIPHTFNFLLWVFWIIMMRINPKDYLEKSGIHKKFGKIRADGNLEVPNMLTVKWIPNYLFDTTEQMSTLMVCLVTLIFCVLGVIIY